MSLLCWSACVQLSLSLLNSSNIQSLACSRKHGTNTVAVLSNFIHTILSAWKILSLLACLHGGFSGNSLDIVKVNWKVCLDLIYPELHLIPPIPATVFIVIFINLNCNCQTSLLSSLDFYYILYAHNCRFLPFIDTPLVHPYFSQCAPFIWSA